MCKYVVLSILSLFCVMGPLDAAALELPDPDTVIAPGETIATLHDDFYAYSAKLNTILGYPGYDFATGTGGLDLLIYTGSNGAKNEIQLNPGPPAEYTFERPMNAPGGNTSTFSGTWGIGNQADGPVLVDDLHAYLQTVFGPDTNTPVFYFDMSQQGANPDIHLAGKVSIWDPTANGGLGGDVAFWALDGIANDFFDVPDLNDLTDPAWVLATGELSIPPYPTVNHNQGSGKADYIAFAAGMNLSDYLGSGYQFRGDFYLGGLNGGGEELFLTGAITPPGVPTSAVPEPATMALFGVGMTGLAAMRKKRAAAVNS